jgi:hypothetical protein
MYVLWGGGDETVTSTSTSNGRRQARDLEATVVNDRVQSAACSVQSAEWQGPGARPGATELL